MKAKTLWDDEYTTITQTKVRTTVRRHYDDTDDEVTYISNETASKLIRDMIAADDDPNATPSHYLTRHIKEIYPVLRRYTGY